MSKLHDQAVKAEKKVLLTNKKDLYFQKEEFKEISKNFEKKINEYQVQMNIYAEILKKMDKKCEDLSNMSME